VTDPTHKPFAPPDLVRILLVEDEPKLRESLAEGLRLEEWNVITAGTGVDALNHLDAEPFDLLVLDWMLPDYDGLEILAQIRTRGLQLPVLMITARNSQADEIRARASGVTDFLAKPFPFAQLLAHCRRLVSRT
jgi:DNA-binding response OmpR family regulator